MSSSFFCSSSQPSHSSLSQSSRGLQLPRLISISVSGQPGGSRAWVRVRARVCVSCKSSAFHVFIFHHCKWSVLDSAGCNYELLSIFRHTQLHSGESLGDVIISVMAQRCHPPSPRTPCIHYNYYLLKISPLLSAGWCSTWQPSADMLLTYMGRRVLIRFLFLHVMAALGENTDLSH